MKRKIALIMVIVTILSIFSGCNLFEETLNLNETAITMTVGDSQTLYIDETSRNIDSKRVVWSSSDNNIVTVNNGLVKAKASGSAVITVTTESGLSKTCNVTVVDKEIEKITLDAQAVSLDVGKTIQLSENITPPDAKKDNLIWSSSDNTVAIVNSEGYITGVTEGIANIFCKSSNGIEASCTVSVKDKSAVESKNKTFDTNTYYGHFNPSYIYRATDFVFPDSSIRRLTNAEIASVLTGMVGTPVADTFAQDAINEIYARNGYVFKTESIRNYYESKPWYYADPSFSISDFNSYESYNIKLLTDYN